MRGNKGQLLSNFDNITSMNDCFMYFQISKRKLSECIFRCFRQTHSSFILCDFCHRQVSPECDNVIDPTAQMKKCADCVTFCVSGLYFYIKFYVLNNVYMFLWQSNPNLFNYFYRLMFHWNINSSGSHIWIFVLQIRNHTSQHRNMHVTVKCMIWTMKLIAITQCSPVLNNRWIFIFSFPCLAIMLEREFSKIYNYY